VGDALRRREGREAAGSAARTSIEAVPLAAYRPDFMVRATEPSTASADNFRKTYTGSTM